MSNIPNYISTLVKPTASKPRGRKVWSIDLEAVWIPFFLATNTVQADLPPFIVPTLDSESRSL